MRKGKDRGEKTTVENSKPGNIKESRRASAGREAAFVRPKPIHTALAVKYESDAGAKP